MGNMFLSSNDAISVFQHSIQVWHDRNLPQNLHGENTIKNLLFKKNSIDTIQWHLEDEIRRADLIPADFISIKRQIDKLNQERTDLVEKIDDYFLEAFTDVLILPGARLQSETPAWMLDRLSILELKIYHMQEQTMRTDVSQEHLELTRSKLNTLLEQRKDLGFCFDSFLAEWGNGKAYFKLYRQMKMYNDKNLNPALYKIPS